VKIALWVVGIVALATVAALSQGGRGNDLSDLPRPSRAFCSAAARYDEITTAKRISVQRHIELMREVEQDAPADTKADAALVVRSYERLAAGDESVVDDPRVKAALDRVNRRATQTCGWFTREGL
jgi:hypothetical protein